MSTGPTRTRSVKVADPASLFRDWTFEIRPAHYAAVGLTLRTFAANKLPYRAWAHDHPMRPDFHEGDVFYLATDPASSARFLQVVATLDPMVEVHTGRVGDTDRHGYLIHSDRLLSWLRVGIDTNGAAQLHRGQGHASAFSWMLCPQP